MKIYFKTDSCIIKKIDIAKNKFTSEMISQFNLYVSKNTRITL